MGTLNQEKFVEEVVSVVVYDDHYHLLVDYVGHSRSQRACMSAPFLFLEDNAVVEIKIVIQKNRQACHENGNEAYE